MQHWQSQCRPAQSRNRATGRVTDPRPTEVQDRAGPETRARQRGTRMHGGGGDETGWSKAISGGDRSDPSDRTDRRSTIESARSRFRGWCEICANEPEPDVRPEREINLRRRERISQKSYSWILMDSHGWRATQTHEKPSRLCSYEQ
jgi:hypothetical protein